MKLKKIKHQKGMTLIELVVAMAIFMLVITIAVGSFVSVLRLQTQTQTMTDVQQNGRIVLEQITRLATQAEEVDKYGGANSDLNKIAFRNGANWICFEGDTGVIKKYTTFNCTGSYFILTSTEVQISKFKFDTSSGIPPILSINLQVDSKNPSGPSSDSINLNTSVLLTGLK